MKLALYMKVRSLTDAQMASKVGCSQVQLWRVRTGNGQPSWSLAKRIVSATGGEVTMDDLAEPTEVA